MNFCFKSNILIFGAKLNVPKKKQRSVIMYCKNCGKYLDEGEVCSCETTVNEQNLSQNNFGGYAPESNHSYQSEKSNKISKKALIAILIIFAIAIVVFVGVKISESIKKQNAYEAIENEALEQLEQIGEDYKEYTTNDYSSEEIYAEKYDTGVTLSDDLFDFTIKMNDTVYKIPMEIDAFLGNGWTFNEYFDDYESLIDSDHSVSAYLYNDDSELYVQVYNYSGNQELFKNCPIGRITYDFSGSLQVYLADDFLLNGKTVDEVIEKYGEPYSIQEYTYCEVTYQSENTSLIYNRYTLEFDKETRVIKSINIVNFIETAEVVDDNSSDTGYLSNYKSPDILTNDLLSGNVSFMGDLYTLPAPVSSFVDNGWEVTESKSIGAGSHDLYGITMTRDGVIATFGVWNFSKYQVDAKDAAIYTLTYGIYDEIYKDDLEMILPCNIKIGTSHSELKVILSEYEGFTMNEGNTNYNYIEVVDDITISISVSKETETVYAVSISNTAWNY